ncbi:hypothetical protein SAMN06295912_11044 [Sphingomonas laterariae]|uniref:Uncharacterized protein n=1 Tax=Edaphosphingomonas laterariae TaxID=861865 RepID=A0A239FTI7_9SPHN|nr:hypothetical protein [Sphingomonas laterariae]SNS60456.1 hypothetical protein SAMN06295912_11044 [Sphingomonas laterariae]
MAVSHRIESPAHPPVQDEICARIAQLDRDFRLLSVGELRNRVDAIRQIARANGMEPVSRLAAGLGDTLAQGGRSPSVLPFLEGMRDAAGCAHQDEETARAYLAQINLRLIGHA